MYETREINTKHRVMLRGRELQTPDSLFTLSQFQTYKYVSSNRLITYMNKPLGVFKKGPEGMNECVTTHDIKIKYDVNLISIG